MTTKTSFPEIPRHLQEYITEQEPALYTPEDHAAWRFIMRVSQSFFKDHAHPLYQAGLKTTGISTDRIPLISEMDSALQKLGWRAVAINGFIPPSVFLEFQALRILAIACDMRKIENLGYTPSPDIVHEAAGHAPIVCDPNYREYLEAYGQIARKAIPSRQDLELYEAINELSETKENPKATQKEIDLTQKKFEEAAAKITHPSEAALLARMAWWTTEYGLIEVEGKPLIYGAGLLSSITESHSCIHPEVKKIPFSLKKVIDTAYDITRPQPQLFVTKDFKSLTHALDEFADTMCFRRGGEYALQVAQEAQSMVTVVLESGIQLTGIVQSHGAHSFTLKEVKQISSDDHAFTGIPLAQFGESLLFPLLEPSLQSLPFEELQAKLEQGLPTLGGGKLFGKILQKHLNSRTSAPVILDQVKIIDGSGNLLFEERSKPYPLIMGSRVTSVFGGAADRAELAVREGRETKKVKSHKTNETEENRLLNRLYQEIRNLRESGKPDLSELERLTETAKNQFPSAWLLHLELLELHLKLGKSSASVSELKNHLLKLAETQNQIAAPIRMGLELNT